MANPVVVNKSNPLSPAEDYDSLRLEGIKHIEKLAGNIWTDYNTHDPGITLLEALCYAITDLAYRTKWDMKDLVAPEKLTNSFWRKIFYTAKKILPCNPVTLNDYRKLLIDIEGVRNAWIALSKDCEVPLYIHYPKFPVDKKEPNPCGDDAKVLVPLKFAPDEGPTDDDKIIELNGLYKVILEFEEDIIEKKEKEKIRRQALRKLHSHRSLCEDFLSVTGAEYKDFKLTAAVILKEEADADRVLAEICFRVQNYFTPNHKFYSLEELAQAGGYTEDIFEGPLLKHGFILDAELEKTDFFRDMRLSDIINSVSDIEDVIAFTKFTVNDQLDPKKTGNPGTGPYDTDDSCGSENYFDEWIAGMKNEKLVGRLNVDMVAEQANEEDKEVIEKDNGGNPVTRLIPAPIKFFKANERVKINVDRFKKLLNDLKAFDRNKKLKQYSADYDVPAGEYSALDEFYPIQYTLPETYKVGEHGLPMKEGNLRLVQALQLKGYLAVFEQLFLNYAAQLNSINRLFSFDEITGEDLIGKIIEGDNTGFKENIKGYLHLYKEVGSYAADTLKCSLPRDTFETKRNKMLDHLLARFAEDFEPYTSAVKYMAGGKDYLPRLIETKTKFLANYPAVSCKRGRGYDYKLEEEAYDYTNTDRDEKLISKNISGLEERIGRLIGMPDITRRPIAPECLFFEITDNTPGKIKGRIRLYTSYDKKEILLETDEFDASCEDEIMHSFIESACCDGKFVSYPNRDHKRRARHYNGEFSFVLVNEENKIIAASPAYLTEEERNKALVKAKKIMQLVCHTEGLHMIEHILLRPRGDEATEDASRPGPVIKTTYELFDVCLDECDATLIFNTGKTAGYKFEIKALPPEKCLDKKRWEVSLVNIKDRSRPILRTTFKEYEQASGFVSSVRNYGSELNNFSVFKNDDDNFPDAFFFRLFDENKKMIAESSKCYSTGGMDPVTRKKKFPDAEKNAGCNKDNTTTALSAWDEIKELKNVLADDVDLYCCEDPCNHNEDPYSFRVSFVLPCWPKRFRNKGFRRLVEQVIQSETPAHIGAKIYWLGIEQMRSFEDAWFEWMVEMAYNDVPDILLANDFIRQVKQLKNCDEHCHHP